MTCSCRKCTCKTPSDANIQSLSQFTKGRDVGFTDEYYRQFKRGNELPFNDWIIAEEANKDGIIFIQRFGMPCTKISLHWQWVYIK